MTTEQEDKLNQIFTAIVGNEATGVRGLAKRVQSLEEYKKKDEALKMKVIGGISVGTPILVATYHKIIDFLIPGSH